jgi:hypothetical protein
MSTHTCKPCSICRGKGYFFVDSWGHTNPVQCEDTDESETCDSCEGTGREGACAQCAANAIAEDDA